MADVSPDTIAFWVVRETLQESFRPLSDCILEALRNNLSQNSIEENSELAERYLNKVSESLRRLEADLLEDGVQADFQLSGDDSYVKMIEGPASALLGRLLSITPTQFEQFCARILTKMGAKSQVTGQPADGGVDFVARDLQLSAPSPRGARVLVIGQAKRYSRHNRISETDLRSFVGGAIRKASDPENALTFRREILAPLVFAFWTTSDFHPTARSYARSVGLWHLNGMGLAQLASRLGVEPT